MAPTVAATRPRLAADRRAASLAAGTYYFVVTETNGFGETTNGPESAQLTVSGRQQSARHVPVAEDRQHQPQRVPGRVNGSSGGPYTLYASGVTASTVDLPDSRHDEQLRGDSADDQHDRPDVHRLERQRDEETARAASLCQGRQPRRRCSITSRRRCGLQPRQPGHVQRGLMKLRHAHVMFAMLDTLLLGNGNADRLQPGEPGQEHQHDRQRHHEEDLALSKRPAAKPPKPETRRNRFKGYMSELVYAMRLRDWRVWLGPIRRRATIRWPTAPDPRPEARDDPALRTVPPRLAGRAAAHDRPRAASLPLRPAPARDRVQAR